MFLLCNQKNCHNSFLNVEDFIKHLHKCHFLRDNPYLKLACTECMKTLTTFNGFKKHIKKHSNDIDHLNDGPFNVENNIIHDDKLLEASSSNLDDGQFNVDNIIHDDKLLETSSSNVINPFEADTITNFTRNNRSKNSLELDIFNLSADLLSLGLPQTTINFVMQKVRDVTKIFSDSAQREINNELNDIISKSKKYLSDDLEKLNKNSEPLDASVLKRMQNVFFSHLNDVNSKTKNIFSSQADALSYHFTRFDSEFKRTKYLHKICPTPKVQELTLRSDVEMGIVKEGTHGHVVKTRTFCYISVKETLSFLFKNQSFKNFFFREPHKEEGIISDFNDGSYFKSNSFFQENKNACQIQLYFDEFDPCDPIGAKKGIHKLGGLYFIIRNLPPFFNSSLENIFLLSLFYSSDLKTHGFSRILRPLIDDLKILEDEGIDIEVDLKEKNIKGTISSLSFDNLGGNMLLGMVESFQARFFCRICKVDRQKIDQLFEEDPSLVRSKENLLECVKLMHSYGDTAFGIKDDSALNHLKYYNSADCWTVDIQHDFPEGVLPYEIEAVIDLFIEKKVFDIEELNKRILSFNYGYLEACNKPSTLKRNKEGKISFSCTSAQMLCLAKFLPLIIGHLVPEELSEYWNVYLLLLDILDIVMSPRISEEMLVELKEKIKDHHSKFLICFPDKKLLPKHHFIIHYPSVIKKMGPPIYYWCMRFEAKHKYFKRIVKKINNYNNLCKTLSDRHQRDVMYKICQKNFAVLFSSPEGTIKKISSLPHSQIITDSLQVTPRTLIKIIKWVKRFSIKYRPNFFLFHAVDELSFPIFLKIVFMFIYEDEYYFLGEVFKTLSYEKNLHSYSIVTSQEYLVMLLKTTRYVHPFESHVNESLNFQTLITPGVVLF